MPKILTGDNQDVSRFMHKFGFKTFGHIKYSDSAEYCATQYSLRIGRFTLAVTLDRPSMQHKTSRLGLALFQEAKRTGRVYYQYKHKAWKFGGLLSKKAHVFNRWQINNDLYLSSNWKTRFIESLIKAIELAKEKSDVPQLQEMIERLRFAQAVA